MADSPKPPDVLKQQVRTGMNTVKYSAVGLPVALILWLVGWGGLAAFVAIVSVCVIGYGAWKVRSAVHQRHSGSGPGG